MPPLIVRTEISPPPVPSFARNARAAGVLNVGAYPTNPPFETKTSDGSFEGFEVDVVNEAAKRAGDGSHVL